MFHTIAQVSISFREKFLPDDSANDLLKYGLRIVSISFREKFLPDRLIVSERAVLDGTCFHLFQREVPS
ncbi:hypothetical protein [Fervidobacterium thailandense]|uniref:Uncharacterized protein n=1 Tax=Fervidobacterium thailandense TaxID=1008305 RepID=A0A1E3G1X7_9BACT|nr:hypothetical protein [Fervidobacterium thailandense]ODN29648.1 hypothetical protein A4H02_09645 [Fervidobacterium thailandense]